MLISPWYLIASGERCSGTRLGGVPCGCASRRFVSLAGASRNIEGCPSARRGSFLFSSTG